MDYCLITSVEVCEFNPPHPHHPSSSIDSHQRMHCPFPFVSWQISVEPWSILPFDGFRPNSVTDPSSRPQRLQNRYWYGWCLKMRWRLDGTELVVVGLEGVVLILNQSLRLKDHYRWVVGWVYDVGVVVGGGDVGMMLEERREGMLVGVWWGLLLLWWWWLICVVVSRSQMD